ncbi:MULTISPECIES: response regulator [Sphingomonas]|uniref:response regulator n=1 Tax=Sphingomonas TaxID=13687 RepID=UPI000DEFCA36|nr:MULTISPECIES: response regulator [Sphingomonas]
MIESSSTVILVVDGDVLVRHGISDYLRDCGYRVVEASNTDEAKVVLEDTSMHIAAVLCDAEAPGSLSPFRLRSWATERRHDVQIALAGNIEVAANKAAELCEQGPHLARPYDPQSVVDYIKRLISAAARDRS